MLNSVSLTGRLTRDPGLRYSPTGIPYARFNLAVNRIFKDKDGERKADFINILTWRKQAENCANYLGKGSLIAISGRIQTGSYIKDDEKRYTTEVVAEAVYFLDSRKNDKTVDTQTPYGEDLQPFDDESELPF